MAEEEASDMSPSEPPMPPHGAGSPGAISFHIRTEVGGNKNMSDEEVSQMVRNAMCAARAQAMQPSPIGFGEGSKGNLAAYQRSAPPSTMAAYSPIVPKNIRTSSPARAPAERRSNQEEEENSFSSPLRTMEVIKRTTRDVMKKAATLTRCENNAFEVYRRDARDDAVEELRTRGLNEDERYRIQTLRESPHNGDEDPIEGFRAIPSEGTREEHEEDAEDTHDSFPQADGVITNEIISKSNDIVRNMEEKIAFILAEVGDGRDETNRADRWAEDEIELKSDSILSSKEIVCAREDLLAALDGVQGDQKHPPQKNNECVGFACSNGPEETRGVNTEMTEIDKDECAHADMDESLSQKDGGKMTEVGKIEEKTNSNEVAVVLKNNQKLHVDGDIEPEARSDSYEEAMACIADEFGDGREATSKEESEGDISEMACIGNEFGDGRDATSREESEDDISEFTEETFLSDDESLLSDAYVGVTEETDARVEHEDTNGPNDEEVRTEEAGSECIKVAVSEVETFPSMIESKEVVGAECDGGNGGIEEGLTHEDEGSEYTDETCSDNGASLHPETVEFGDVCVNSAGEEEMNEEEEDVGSEYTEETCIDDESLLADTEPMVENVEVNQKDQTSDVVGDVEVEGITKSVAASKVNKTEYDFAKQKQGAKGEYEFFSKEDKATKRSDRYSPVEGEEHSFTPPVGSTQHWWTNGDLQSSTHPVAKENCEGVNERPLKLEPESTIDVSVSVPLSSASASNSTSTPASDSASALASATDSDSNSASDSVSVSAPSASASKASTSASEFRSNCTSSISVETRNFSVHPPKPKTPRSAETILQDNTKVFAPLTFSWRNPKPELKSLLLAAKGDSIVRRSNACGALKVLASKRANQVRLAHTRGVLDALVFAASDIRLGFDAETSVEARTRAVTTIAHLSEPKEARVLFFQCPGLPECLVKVINEDKCEARMIACRVLAMMSKVAHIKGELVQVRHLVSTLSGVLRQKGRERGKFLIAVTSNDEDCEVDFKDMTGFSSDSESPRPIKKAISKPVVDCSWQLNDAKYEEYLSFAQLNSCAAFMHLAKECRASADLCKSKIFLDSITCVCKDFESPLHTRCLEIFCHLTRFSGNSVILTSRESTIKLLVACGNAGTMDDRLWAVRSVQNLASDTASRILLATESVLTLLTASAVRGIPDEQNAALGALLNISYEPGAIVPLTNTKNLVATLVHVTHNTEPSSDCCRLACDTLAVIGAWMQTLAGVARAADGEARQHSQATTGWLKWE